MSRIAIFDLPIAKQVEDQSIIIGGRNTTSGKSFSEVVASGLTKAVDVAMSAGQLAAPFIPGGSVLSAATSGVSQLKNSAGG